jgi:hypothetical protein
MRLSIPVKIKKIAMGVTFAFAAIALIVPFQNCTKFSAEEPVTKSGPGPVDSGVELVPDDLPGVVADFSKVVAAPLLKSKVGFARNVSGEGLLGSVDTYLNELGPGMFCSAIDFDHYFKFDGSGSSNPALSEVLTDPNDPDSRPIETLDSPAAWLGDFQTALQKLNIKSMHEIAGAPAQFQETKIVKPAIHRPPTDLLAASKFMARWAASGKHKGPVYWNIWLEPGHTLAGVNRKFDVNGDKTFPNESDAEFALRESQQRSVAVGALNDVYQNYYRAMRETANPDDVFGLSSFLAADFEPEKLTAESQIFFKGTFSEWFLRRDQERNLGRDLQTGFISFHSFNGKWAQTFSGARNVLETELQSSSFVLSQYSPGVLNFDQSLPADQRPTVMATVTSWLNDWDGFIQATDLEHVCFSYWIGGNYGFTHVDKTGKLVSQLPFEAMKLYFETPVLRRYLRGVTAIERDETGTNSKLGVHGWASANSQRAAVFLWNDSSADISTPIHTFNVPSSIKNGLLTSKVYTLSDSMSEPAISTLTDNTIVVPAQGIAVLIIENAAEESLLKRRDALAPVANDLNQRVRFVGSTSENRRAEVACVGAKLPGVDRCFESTRDFANYDQIRDVAYLGLGSAVTSASTTATFENLGTLLKINYQVFGTGVDVDKTGSLKLTVELLGCEDRKSVVLARRPESGERLESKIGTGETFVLNLVDLAGTCDWKSGPRRAKLGFTIGNLNAGAQAEVYVSGR